MKTSSLTFFFCPAELHQLQDLIADHARLCTQPCKAILTLEVGDWVLARVTAGIRVLVQLRLAYGELEKHPRHR